MTTSRRTFAAQFVALAALGGCKTPLIRGLGYTQSKRSAGINIDAHAHIFNAADLPIAGFAKHFTDPHGTSLVNSPPFVRELIKTLEALRVTSGEDTFSALLDDLAKALAIAPGFDDEMNLLDTIAAVGSVDLARLEPPIPTLAPALIALDQSTSSLSDWGAGPLEFVRAGSSKLPDKSLVGRLMQLVRLATRHRITILGTLSRTYPNISLFCHALVDYDAWLRRLPLKQIEPDLLAETSMLRQVLLHNRLSRLCAAGKVPYSPDNCTRPRAAPELLSHGYVAFCPKRAASNYIYTEEIPKRDESWITRQEPLTRGSTPLDLVKYAVEHCGFIGVKLYPPVGFFPYANKSFPFKYGHCDTSEKLARQVDHRLDQLYSYATSHDMPILAHASFGNSFREVQPDVAGPAGWIECLDAYPNLRVCLAHFLHKKDPSHWSTYGDHGALWADALCELAVSYPNVYLDMSNSKVQEDEAFAREFYVELARLAKALPGVERKIMWGSDFWMNHMRPQHLYFHEHTEARYLAHMPGEDETKSLGLSRLMGDNALRFLGLFDEEGHKTNNTSGPRKRLEAFYADAPGGLPLLLTAETVSDLAWHH